MVDFEKLRRLCGAYFDVTPPRFDHYIHVCRLKKGHRGEHVCKCQVTWSQLKPNEVEAFTWCCPKCMSILFYRRESGKECARCGHLDKTGEGEAFKR